MKFHYFFLVFLSTLSGPWCQMPLFAEEDTYTVIYAADVASGRLKKSSELSIKGTETIVSTEVIAPDKALGHTWQLDQNQLLEFHFNLPEKFKNPRVELIAIGLKDEAASIAIFVNNGQLQRFDSAKFRTYKNFALDNQKLVAGKNILKLGSAKGRVGIQALKVIFDCPYPQVIFGPKESPSVLTILEPSSKAPIFPSEGQVTIRWKISNAPPSTFVNLLYRADGGRVLPIPGGIALPYNAPSRHDDAGQFTWILPKGKEMAKLEVLVEPFTVQVAKKNSDLLTFKKPLSQCLVTQDCRYVVVVEGYNSDMLDIYNVATGKKERSVKLTANRRMALSPDGRYLFATDGKTVGNSHQVFGALYDLQTGKEIKTYDLGVDDPIQKIVYMSDGKTVALQSMDAGVTLLDLDSGNLKVLPPLRDRRARILAASPNGDQLAVELLGKVRIDLLMINTDSGKVLWEERDWYSGVGVFSPSGDSFFVQRVKVEPRNPKGLLEPEMVSVQDYFIFDTRSGKLKKRIPVKLMKGVVTDVGAFSPVFTPDGSRILTSDISGRPVKGKLILRDVKEGKIVKSFDIEVCKHYEVTISPDGQFAIIPSNHDGHIVGGALARSVYVLEMPK
jgi:hypothetical protein